MNIFSKVGFLLVILIFGFIIISPLVEEFEVGTEIIFFGAGDADSILIKNKTGTILIDAGLKENRELLGDKLRTLGVRRIDYMILTHPDKDHIGGASYILDNFKVENLLQSKLKKGSKAETRIEKSLAKKPINTMVIEEDYEFSLGGLDISIYAPIKDSYKKSNDYSLVTEIRDRDLAFLFAGDAEKKLLEELLARDLVEMDIYKLPHHGRWNSNSEEMIEKTSPKIAVITSDKADERIVAALEKEGSRLHYAFDNDIYFYSDGSKIEKR